MANKLEKFLNQIILWGVYITMFLPLAISPLFLLPDKFAKVVLFRIIVEIILIPFLFLALYKKKYRPRFNVLAISIAIFWLVGLISVFFSTQPFSSVWGSATRGSGFFNFTHYIIFFFILTGVVQTKEQWKKIFNLAIAVAALVSIFALSQKIIPGLNPEFMNSSADRPSGTMGNPIMLANYLVMLIFIAFAFWREETTSKTSVSISRNPYRLVSKRIFYFISGLLMLGAIFATETRGALLGLVSGLFFFLLFYPFVNIKFTVRKRILILFSILVVILLLFLFNSALHIIPERIFTLGNINRITSWQIAVEAIKDKPLLGWGPDNFAIPFDKYYQGGYTASYKNLAETWWDKAHNVPLDIGVNMGLLGLVAYFGIFFALFWRLREVTRSVCAGLNPAHKGLQKISAQNNTIVLYALVATFIAYFVQNLTSFDSVMSYILFFTLLAYINASQSVSIRHNPYESVSNESASKSNSSISSSKFLLWAIASIVIVFIVIKASVIPFYLNYKTNKIAVSAREGNYRETIEPYREIVNKYQGKTYYEKELNEKFMKIARHFAPAILHQVKDREEYIKLNQETIDLIKRSAEMEPLHTKHYYNIGLFYNNISGVNPNIGSEGISYFEKALELSPNREHLLIESAKARMIIIDYVGAIEKLKKVTLVNPRLPDSYLWLGVTYLYKGDIDLGKKYIEFAEEFGIDMGEIMTLRMLAGVYSDIQLWEEAISYYLLILEQDYGDIETRALLAGSYKKIGEIKKAREQAEILLKISPEAKESIEQFLNTL